MEHFATVKRNQLQLVLTADIIICVVCDTEITQCVLRM